MIPSREWQRSRQLTSFIALLTLISVSDLQAGEFSLSGGFQLASGKYIYQTTTTAYSLTAGARLHSDEYSVSIALPVLFQNSDLVTRSGGMLLPHGDGVAGQMQGTHHGGGMMSNSLSTSSTSYESGLGDILAMGSFRVIKESQMFPSVAVTGQLKAPTARTAMNFGTGKWDYGGGVSMRKKFGSVGVFGDVGYLVIGDPDGVNYHDPFTFGIGVGKVFGEGTISAMVYYQAYTRVLENYDPPQQLSAGFLYQSSPSTTLSLMSSFGLSNTTPALGVAMSVEVTI